jgi:hypothetical protein
MARDDSGEKAGGWPGWAKAGATALILVHGSAVLAAVMAASPSSDLQRAIADQFRWYYKLADQGYTYRFYTAGAPPTPILLAELQFEDGRTEERRIPDRSQAPRLRFQRHLALAYHLFEDVRRAPRDPDTGQSRSRWAASYARHLCAENPGCTRVVLFIQDHLNPSPRELVEAAREGRAIDVEDPRYYGDRQRIGAYSCED